MENSLRVDNNSYFLHRAHYPKGIHYLPARWKTLLLPTLLLRFRWSGVGGSVLTVTCNRLIGQFIRSSKISSIDYFIFWFLSYKVPKLMCIYYHAELKTSKHLSSSLRFSQLIFLSLFTGICHGITLASFKHWIWVTSDNSKLCK